MEFNPFLGYLQLDHPVTCEIIKCYSHIQIITWIKSYNFFFNNLLPLIVIQRKERERKSVLKTFHAKWNFATNVNCDCNKNIPEAISITFPGKQTIMKHDINKFSLTQSECRIQNYLINLLVNRKKLNVFFLPLSF